MEQLRNAGVPVVVIDEAPDPRLAPVIRRWAVPHIARSALDGEPFGPAGLAGAAAVICAESSDLDTLQTVMTSSDMTNIETALAVRDGLGERFEDIPVVMRVFDRPLANRLEETFAFRHVWSTAAIAAPWFVGAAIGMEVLSTFYVGNLPILVARFDVRDGGGLDGLALAGLGARVRVVAIERDGGELEHPPRRDTRLAAGDRAYLAGPYNELMRVLRANGAG